MSEDRDILIELRSDLKHVRGQVEHLVASDTKQWEKMDSHGVKIEGHDKTLSFLTRGFWGAVSGIAALGWAWVKGDR